MAVDRCLWPVHGVHGWRWQGVDFIAGRLGVAGQRAGSVPGRQRFRGTGGGTVGRLPVGCRWPSPTADLGNRWCRIRGGLARYRSVWLPHGGFDGVERKGRRPDTDDRIAALRCVLGDTRGGRSATDGHGGRRRKLLNPREPFEKRSLPMVLTVERI